MNEPLTSTTVDCRPNSLFWAFSMTNAKLINTLVGRRYG